MSREALASALMAAVAGLGAGPATAEAATVGPQSAHRAPAILGTLDPKTGKFTPDAPPDYIVITGTLNIVFKLDASRADTTSVACVVTTNTDFDEATGYITAQGANRPDAVFLNYSKGTDKFFGSLQIPFAYVIAGFPRYGYVDVRCYYTFDPHIQVYHLTYQYKPHSGDNYLTIGGVMDGYSF